MIVDSLHSHRIHHVFGAWYFQPEPEYQVNLNCVVNSDNPRATDVSRLLALVHCSEAGRGQQPSTNAPSAVSAYYHDVSTCQWML